MESITRVVAFEKGGEFQIDTAGDIDRLLALESTLFFRELVEGVKAGKLTGSGAKAIARAAADLAEEQIEKAVT